MRATKNVKAQKTNATFSSQNLFYSENEQELSSEQDFTFSDKEQDLKITGGTFFYDLKSQKIYFQKNVIIETKDFSVRGEEFLLDFSKELLTSNQKTKTKDKKNGVELLANFFQYDLKNKKLKAKK
jgi:lipopolysaccharide export system protein LptA